MSNNNDFRGPTKQAFVILLLIFPYISVANTLRIFPYVVAGDIEKILPDLSKVSYKHRVPPPLNELQPLRNNINKIIVDDMLDTKYPSTDMNTLQPSLKNGLLDFKFDHILTVSKKIMYFVQIIIFLPFMWFLLAGSSKELYRIFITVTTGYSVHVILFTWVLHGGMPSLYGGLFSIISGLLASTFGFYFYRHFWLWIVTWHFIIILSFIRIFPFLGPYLFTTLIPTFSEISSFQTSILLISSILTSLTHFIKCFRKKYHYLSSIVISVTSAYGCVSGFSVVYGLFGIPCAYNYINFFSVPGLIDFSTNISRIQCFQFILLICIGLWINILRYKRMGFYKPEQGDAATALKELPQIEEKV